MPSKAKGHVLSYYERKLARQLASTRRRAVNQDIDDLLNLLEDRAKELSKKHRKSTAWFLHQLYQGGRVARQKRSVNVFNAAQQIEGFLQGRKGGAWRFLF